MAYRLGELGWLQFERLTTAALELEAGVPPSRWSGSADQVRWVVVDSGVAMWSLPGPTLVVVAWMRDGPLREQLDEAITHASLQEPARIGSILVLTNVDAPESLRLDVAPGARTVVLGRIELSELIDSRAALRYHVPSVLGARDLADVLRCDAAERSTADLAAAHALARVFVPTRVYTHAVEVVARHRFAVLKGPPEMGKTAIARMIALAAVCDGYEAHECIRPEQFWALFDRDRRQVFVVDDAFGSTEYHPDAGERWAVELDGVLRATDQHHWLLWTSRPAPLNVGLRRIHREHGVERFPQPAEVQVDAAELDSAEKAMMLLRHAKAVRLTEEQTDAIRRSGWPIVSDPHFTPARIQRFVHDRLPHIAPADLIKAVPVEIREPTEAMVASFRALAPEDSALLVAMIDVPPGPVPERELAAAMRRHANGGLSRQPAELVDRLSDHFVRAVPPVSIVWVHPSWRDLVIAELAADSHTRAAFLERCSLDGLLLALSVAGGAAGERTFPLLVADSDWDTVAARLDEIAGDLDDPSLFRLLAAVRVAVELAPDVRTRAEAAAIAQVAVASARRTWDAANAVIPVTLLSAWFRTAALIPDKAPPPNLAPTWIELLPSDQVAEEQGHRLEEWLRLVRLLREHEPEALESLGGVPPGLLAETHIALAAKMPPEEMYSWSPPDDEEQPVVPPDAVDRSLVHRILRDL